MDHLLRGDGAEVNRPPQAPTPPPSGIVLGLSPDGRSLVIVARFIQNGTVMLGAELSIPGDQAGPFIARLVELQRQLRTVVLPGDVQ